MNHAIEIRDLTRSYGALTAVDQLSLTIGAGEFFALLGVNGAGKTTTIRMLCGLTAPTSGDALVCGHSLVHDAHAAKSVIGVSPQETAVARNLTVRENLELAAGIYGASRAQARAKADAMIADFALQKVEAKRARTLSGGWQRRLSIAMALIPRPKVLFLDEPTLGLDVLARRELWEHMRTLKGRVTVVLTTHDLEEAQALSDRIGILTDGRLRAVGTAAELMAQTGTANFEDAFVLLAAGAAVKGESV